MQVIDMSLATSSTKHLVRIVLFVYKTSYNLYFYLSLNLYSYIRPLSSIQNKFAFILHEPYDLSMDSMQAGSSTRYQIYVDHLRYLCTLAIVWYGGNVIGVTAVETTTCSMSKYFFRTKYFG